MSSLTDYHNLLQTIKSTIQQSQQLAYRRVNTQLIETYFHIGQILNEQMENNGRGKSIVEQLAQDLKKEFGDRQ
jgi:predicted nuclease of restriction endonuclease-like (RecB) superfamily